MPAHHAGSPGALQGFVLLVDRAGSAGGQVTARGHGSAVHLPCPDQDKCSFECQTETGQEMVGAGSCKHNGQGEHTPSVPSVGISRVKGERWAPSMGDFSQTEGGI